MVNHTDIIRKDLKHIWHPCSQMKDFELFPPLVVHQAKGSYITTNQGILIDGISSWWCKSLGHGHPTVTAAIKKQLTEFEHVIAADTTHPLLAELGEKLAAISGKQHVYFASDGSSAVEIALKLTLHANQLNGRPHRNQFIALKNAYHGETLATLSVSDLGIYKQPYQGYGVDCHFIAPLPYVSDQNHPLWLDAEAYWQQTYRYLETIKEKVCALIVEPIVQGAGGMLCYSADYLAKLVTWAKTNNIYVIADEIMTGMGRTGQWLACQHAQVEADLICLSKGLTGGTIPLSCVLIDKNLFELFYADYDQGRSFLHSHTYSGNALGVAAALAVIKVMEKEAINQQAEKLGQQMIALMQEIAVSTGKLINVRSIGAIAAADFTAHEKKRIGYLFQQQAVKGGALLRPLGNTLYWLPPLNTDEQTIVKLAEITLNSINAAYA